MGRVPIRICGIVGRRSTAIRGLNTACERVVAGMGIELGTCQDRAVCWHGEGSSDVEEIKENGTEDGSMHFERGQTGEQGTTARTRYQFID